MSTQYRLIVNVNDVNDCAPKFTRLNYQFRVSNSSPIGYLLGQVSAIDDDYSPDYRRIQYQFLENDSPDIISIDSNNGSLFLMKSSSIEMELNITVLALDSHNNSLFDQANIEIFFYDEIPCISGFSQVIYVFNTTEHERIPYELGKVCFSSCWILMKII